MAPKSLLFPARFFPVFSIQKLIESTVFEKKSIFPKEKK